MDLAGWAGLTDRGVAHVAHLAGYLWGGLTALLLLPTPAMQRSDTDLPALIRRWRRRRAWVQTVSTTPAQQSAAPPPAQPGFITLTRRHLRSNRIDEALAAWSEGASSDPEAAMPAADQLLLANCFQARGKSEEAADAYGRYLQRYGTSREAVEVRLLLGLLLTRSLGQPERAVPLLRNVLGEALDDKRRVLAETLLREATG
jgi:tetratricopeptide (TPR) repeat protein